MLYLVIKAALSGIIIADSGGPAFLNHKDQLCIAAVSSSQDDGGLGEGRYGVRELYPGRLALSGLAAPSDGREAGGSAGLTSG